MVAFHHVNLGVPPEGIDEEATFLVDMLGYERIAAPAELEGRNVNWFRAADGSEVHLSQDPDHRPAARAHVAVVVGDEFDDVAERIRGRGTEIEIFDGIVGVRVAICRDPAGNRWELRSA
jgi:catechol 2,3-dioxygenase-like lactoylglutathione lyase family enzyme